MKNFIDIKDFTAEEITELLNSAIENKNQNAISEKLLSGKNLILFFEKNSTRTRLSFELAEKRLSSDIVNFSASSSSVPSWRPICYESNGVVSSRSSTRWTERVLTSTWLSTN